MKVLHVVHGYPPEVIGGTELYVARLAAAQRALGDEVAVFAGSLQWRPKLEVRHAEQDGVRVTRVHREDLYFDRWDKGFHPGVSREFERHLGQAKPDLVHVHHWLRLSTDLVAAAARAGIPAVVTLHDLYATCPRVFRLKGEHGDEPCEVPMATGPCVPCVPRWRFQRDDEIAELVRSYRADMSRELEFASAVVAPSRAHGTFLASMLGFSAARLHVLQHGTLGNAPAAAAAPRRSGDGRLHLAYWGHMTFLKGTHVLLEAARAAANRDRLRVHLYGAESDVLYKERLEEAAAGLDVEFHGAYRPADLRQAPIDVAVIPTLCRESYSFILDEAAALGVPILASGAGALADRATGRVQLFRQNDPRDLARHIDLLVEDPTRLERMRAAPAPELVPFERHAAEMRALYERTVAAGPPSPPPARDDVARLAEQWRRREVAFQELVRIEKWEDIVEEQRKRIAELERLMSRRLEEEA
jgi:glycosyltransferase involved in cell wall biosynthesis